MIILLKDFTPIFFFFTDKWNIKMYTMMMNNLKTSLVCFVGTKQSCVDSLAFETMIPKTVIQRYISLLLEHHRIILCGPSGTGKTYLAQKLAEHVVLRLAEVIIENLLIVMICMLESH